MSLLVSLGGGGCAERAELLNAREHTRRGELREAYREYHQAYLESDDLRDRDARDHLGGQISSQLEKRALAAERAGDLPAALMTWHRALEYDPDRPGLIAHYLIARGRLDRVQAVTVDAASRRGDWEAYRLWRDLRAEEPSPTVLREMAEAAAAATDSEIAVLSLRGPEVLGDPDGADGSFSLFVPGGAAGLTERLAAVRDLSSRLEEIVRDGGPEASPWLEDLLAPHRSFLDGTARAVERALRAESARAAAAGAEEAGDLQGAVRGYRRSLLLWPERPAVRDGLDRALEAVVQRACELAVSAMNVGRWDEALRALKTLHVFEPADPTVQDRALHCRNEVRSGLLAEGIRLREGGYPGNALVLFLRARVLGLGEALEREIGILEEEVQARYACEFRVDTTALTGGDAAASRQAPAASRPPGDALFALLGELDRVFPSAGASEKPAGEPPGRARPDGTVLSAGIEDVDFRYQLETIPGGLGECRFVADFLEAENPERSRATEELAAARRELEAARAALEAAGVGEQADAVAVLSIAEGRERQAAAAAERTLATVPVPVWRKETFPVTRVRVESSLALLVRMEGVSRWIEARTSAEGREVEGDGRRGIAPETPVVPSRAEALGSLAATVCQKLAGALEERRVARFDRLVERALGRLEGAPGEEAVEDLVAFLYARRAEDDSPGFRRAAEALRRTTGLDLAAAWASGPNRISDPQR